jgi:hypothetical protein
MADVKRCAIVGTAPSWAQTPWDDPTLKIFGLNDGYTLGVPRADEWFDLHPIDKMWFRPKNKTTFVEGEIPDGAYVRPEGHLDWMQGKAQSIPVWLRDEPPAGWPVNAQRFPYEEVLEFLKARPDQDAYIASSPVQMLAYAIVRGYTEIHIYGIHLATQAEYLKQRPNFEWAMGKAEGMGISIVLPPECPLLKHTHIYGREAEPARPDAAAIKLQKQIQRQMNKVANELIAWPRWKSKDKPLAEWARLNAALRDAQIAARHAIVTAGL